MERTLKNLKRNWYSLAKFSILIIGIVTVLIIPPPIEYNSNTVKFLITIITGFLFIPIFSYNKAYHFKLWMIISICTFVVALSLYISYNIFYDRKVVKYSGADIVIGNNILDSALKEIVVLDKEDHEIYEDNSPTHNYDLLSFKSAHADNIWSFEDIKSNKFLLTSLFYLSVSFTSILILCLMQTIQVLLLKK
jgi:hypothetical protein